MAYDWEGWARIIKLAWHAPPINAHRVLAHGLDGSNAVAFKTSAGGNLQVDVLSGGGSPATAGTATLANVATSTSNATLLASNAARLGATFYNDSLVTLYLKCGATASATSFTVALRAAAYYEMPFNYTGIVDGILASSTGTCRVSEFVA
jgi:hypothetical protein